MAKIKKIILDSASILDASEAKEIRAGELAAILEAGSGSSDRTSSCEGKHYGDSCSFMTDKGYVQSGKCIYNKWGWTPGGFILRSSRLLSESYIKNLLDK